MFGDGAVGTIPLVSKGASRVQRGAVNAKKTEAGAVECGARTEAKIHGAQIAKALKRTESATRQKAFGIGLSLDSRA